MTEARTMERKKRIERKTTETEISVDLNLDGSGRAEVSTGIPFFDHMLTLMARHGLLDLEVSARGDIEVDFHHTVEDTGIAIGEALKGALGDKSGIRRYGRADTPMMDSLASVVLDISGRPYLKLNVGPEALAVSKKVYSARRGDGAVVESFDMGLAEEFAKALSNTAGVDLHVFLHYGTDIHHAIEAIFKSLGRAIGEAVALDPRIKGVMSTKGRL